MIEMHSKYDKMHTNRMFYALICINNHIFVCYDCMLSMSMAYPIAISVETLHIDNGCSLEKEFTKLIRMNP